MLACEKSVAQTLAMVTRHDSFPATARVAREA